MSNFYCPECGEAIIEGDDGEYVNGCPHYQLESTWKKRITDGEFLRDIASIMMNLNIHYNFTIAFRLNKIASRLDKIDKEGQCIKDDLI